MYYKLISKQYNEKYGENILKERGVKDIEQFLTADIKNIEDPFLLTNMFDGVKLLNQSLNKKGKIILCVDSDVDGYTSAAIIYQYIKKIDQSQDIHFLLHNGKQHGLEDLLEEILNIEETIKLVIIPDASSNDTLYHKELFKENIPVLILDHHIVEEDTKILQNVVLINNQYSLKYKNKNLTGAGVALQFCRAYDIQYGYNFSELFFDLAALGLIGDMGSVLSLENRSIIQYGLNNINNILFKELIKKQSYSMQNKINNITIAFYIVPLINSMIRVGDQDQKYRLFLSFINPHELVCSQKRGEKGKMVEIYTESIRECINTKNKQNKLRDKAIELIKDKIEKEDLLNNKILFISLDDYMDFPPELNGLIAMKLTQEYNKPTIICRENSEHFNRGSARGLNNSELLSFKNLLKNTNLFEYTAGHDNAFGISIKSNKIDKLLELTNNQLQNIDFNSNYYEVNFLLNGQDNNISNIIFDLDLYENTWGQDNNVPLFCIDNIPINSQTTQIIGNRKDTLKIIYNDITYIKFFAKDLINNIDFTDKKCRIIGKSSVNVWLGKKSPQIIIDDIEIYDDLSF